uniref:Uncharacterized protein n=1 Tax=Knipowitschia caucasica TaxID=637954 RepID=A0AAV2M317_KNICA
MCLCLLLCRTEQSCVHLQKTKPSENTQESVKGKHSRMSRQHFQKPSKPPPPASDQAQSVPSAPRTRRHTDRCTPDPAPPLCTPDPAPRLCTPDPAPRLCTPDPAPRLCTPDPAPRLCTPDPAPRLCTPDPAPRLCTPDPAPRLCTPDPAPRLCTPDPAPPLCTPDPAPRLCTPDPAPPLCTPDPAPRLCTPDPAPRLCTPDPAPRLCTPDPAPRLCTPDPAPPLCTPDPAPRLCTPDPAPRLCTPDPAPPLCTPDPAPRLCTPDPAPRLRQRPHFTDDDSDTDLSESEKGSVPCGPPPQLKLRPELIVPDQAPSRKKNKSKFDFPDFLPPPFNSWSLHQLAYFYHMEGRSRPRASGPLERYLERLIQLEWNQIKTRDTNRTTHTEPLSSRQRSPGSSSARLSAPKCILQCQRAFPFTVLSPGPSHCSYVVCTTRNSSCSCRPSKSSPPPEHRRPSRSSPPPEHRRPSRSSPLPEHRRSSVFSKRSHSEGRALLHRQRFQSPVQNPVQSPVQGQGHLQQMQAAGNIRTSAQTYNHDHRHRSNATVQGQTEVRSSSGRRGRSESRGERRAVKPDAVQAIMEQLAAAKSCALYRPHTKQVAFVM